MSVSPLSLQTLSVRLLLGSAILLGSSIAAAAEDAKPAPKKEKATADDYALDLQNTTKTLALNTDGTFSLVIRAKNGTKLHAQAPLEVSIRSGDALQLEKQKLGRGDAVKTESQETELRTTFRARQRGSHPIAAELSFFLCTDAWCQRMTDRIELSVEVTE